MNSLTRQDFIWLGVSLLAAALGILGRVLYGKKLRALESVSSRQRLRRRLLSLLSVVGSWIFVVRIIGIAFRGAPGEKEFKPELFAAQVPFFGIHVSSTVVTTWGIIAVIFVLALTLRLTVLRHMKEKPAGIQLVLETLVEQLDKYIHSKVEGMSEAFGAYLFSLALFLIASASVELLGLHAPTADLTMTFALSMMTFFLINYYGFKRRGVLGRIKSLASIRTPDIPEDTPRGERIKLHLKSIFAPTSVAFPFRILSDIAIPVSMACRLFGNMLGGMIVIDLLYMALGSAAVGIPSVAGLYFNIFHPMIQAFIFLTLTLTFINEAVEDPA
ncbi:MAG: F0F1 ATP synthase subunit A [Oscillospiraceae bacterium]|jgi:F-type H+-transporting ATPase subunit a|nr:F0F1 ATP synthase subunit A [Oscillospiraceae bacterium]